MDPNAKNKNGDTPLHTACRNERSRQVQLLVRDERCNPHEKDSRGDTALHVACRHHYGGELFTICCHVSVVYMNIIHCLINCSVQHTLNTKFMTSSC